MARYYLTAEARKKLENAYSVLDDITYGPNEKNELAQLKTLLKDTHLQLFVDEMICRSIEVLATSKDDAAAADALVGADR